MYTYVYKIKNIIVLKHHCVLMLDIRNSQCITKFVIISISFSKAPRGDFLKVIEYVIFICSIMMQTRFSASLTFTLSSMLSFYVHLKTM
jgi:hypothetical protein